MLDNHISSQAPLTKAGSHRPTMLMFLVHQYLRMGSDCKVLNPKHLTQINHTHPRDVHGLYIYIYGSQPKQSGICLLNHFHKRKFSDCKLWVPNKSDGASYVLAQCAVEESDEMDASGLNTMVLGRRLNKHGGTNDRVTSILCGGHNGDDRSQVESPQGALQRRDSGGHYSTGMA